MFQPRAADYCQTPARPSWVIDLESSSRVFVATPMTQRKSSRRTAHLNPAWIAEPQNCKSRIIIVDNYIRGRGSYYAAIDRNRTQSWRFGWHKHHYHYHLFASDHTQDRTWRLYSRQDMKNSNHNCPSWHFVQKNNFPLHIYGFLLLLFHQSFAWVIWAAKLKSYPSAPRDKESEKPSGHHCHWGEWMPGSRRPDFCPERH